MIQEVISPEVHPDNSVTFRLSAPDANQVHLWGIDDPKDMAKDAEGTWSVTVGPLTPLVYFYAFDIDGAWTIDPENPSVKASAPSLSMVEIVGDKPSPWDILPVEHGQLTMQWYTSEELHTERRFHVYTPPKYNDDDTEYPVLYLLHGWGDDDSAWSSIGRVNFIMDNLIAAGKAKPMIIVMTNGHTFNPHAYGVRIPDEDADRRAQILGEYRHELLNYVLPIAEAQYRIKPGRENRAIAGLSMGGWHTLSVGLPNTDLFSHIGAFSTGVGNPEELAANTLSNPQKLNDDLKLLWIACGEQDALYSRSEGFVKKLEEKGVKHTWVTSPGIHSWQMWRKHISQFLPLLFR